MRGLYRKLHMVLNVPPDVDLRPIVQKINIMAIKDLLGVPPDVSLRGKIGRYWFKAVKLLRAEWDVWRKIASGQIKDFTKEDLLNENYKKFAEIVSRELEKMPTLKKILEELKSVVAKAVEEIGG